MPPRDYKAYKDKDYFKDRKSLKGVPDLRHDNPELKQKQSEGMRKYQARKRRLAKQHKT